MWVFLSMGPLNKRILGFETLKTTRQNTFTSLSWLRQMDKIAHNAIFPHLFHETILDLIYPTNGDISMTLFSQKMDSLALPLRLNAANEISFAHEQRHPAQMFSYPTVKLYFIIQHKIRSESFNFHPPPVILLVLLSQNIHDTLQRSATHTYLRAHRFSCTVPKKLECRKQRCAHLTERCRISVRDLLMLLAILISSFSSESVYWASWSRLRAQSARLASSSACTACGKDKAKRVRRNTAGRLTAWKKNCASLRAVAPKWHDLSRWVRQLAERKTKRRTDFQQCSSAPLMISISFAVFTALWPYVANECRVTTMQEEGGREVWSGEGGAGGGGGGVEWETERYGKVGVREEGSGPRSQNKHAD